MRRKLYGMTALALSAAMIMSACTATSIPQATTAADTTDRYSFKINFGKYVDDQTFMLPPCVHKCVFEQAGMKSSREFEMPPKKW